MREALLVAERRQAVRERGGGGQVTRLRDEQLVVAAPDVRVFVERRRGRGDRSGTGRRGRCVMDAFGGRVRRYGCGYGVAGLLKRGESTSEITGQMDGKRTSWMALRRCRNRGGSSMTSSFSRCSSASPDAGLGTTAGLSVSDTKTATPSSGVSRWALA